MPTIIRQFRELNAEVEFSLRNILTTDQIQMLEVGSLDIGFLRLPIGICGSQAVDLGRIVARSIRLARRLAFVEVSLASFLVLHNPFMTGKKGTL